MSAHKMGLLQLCKVLIPAEEKKNILLIIFFMLVSGVLEALSIGGISPLVAMISDPAGSSGDGGFLGGLVHYGKTLFGAKFLFVLALGLLAIFVVKNVFLYYFIVVANKFVFRNQADVETKLYAGYLKAPYSYHLNANTADLIRNIKIEVAAVLNSVIRPLLTVVVDGITVVAITALLVIVAPVVTIVSFVSLGAASYLFTWILKKKLAMYGVARQSAASQMIKWINQGLGGVKEIKVLGREDYFVNVFGKSALQNATVETNFNSLSQTPRLYFETLTIAGMLTLIVVLHWYNPASNNVFPLLAMFSLAGMRLMPSVNRVLSNITNIRYNYPALELVVREMQLLKAKKKSSVTPPHHQNIIKEGLFLDRVSFQYPGVTEKTLDHVSLEMGKHEAIGIVGKTGAGKTTLINLILDLIQPTAGTIYIDGVEIDESVSKLGRYAGYVPQEVYLLDDTVRRNIAYGLNDDQIDDKKVWEVLKLAKLDTFIAASPEGLDAIVGERGVRISGGQKQRLGIARALYSDPRLLIFDEPTSALDAETEREIGESIAEVSTKKMVIIVTHRDGLLKLCDRTFRVANGQLELLSQRDVVCSNLTQSDSSIREANL